MFQNLNLIENIIDVTCFFLHQNDLIQTSQNQNGSDGVIRYFHPGIMKYLPLLIKTAVKILQALFHHLLSVNLIICRRLADRKSYFTSTRRL